MDLVIRDATVVDGSGATAPYRADVAVADGRIAEIRRAAHAPRLTARRTLDAAGLVLSPGFVDMHAHSDLACSATPITRRRSRRASPWRSSARTGCPTPGGRPHPPPGAPRRRRLER